MTITATGTGAYRTAKPNEFVSNRAQFDDLQRQLTTGKKSETYGDLGVARRTSLDLNAKVATIDSWLSGIELADVNLKLSGKTVEQLGTLTAKTLTDVQPSGYTPSSTEQTGAQVLAEGRLSQMIDLLNVDVNGRYLFSGRTTDTRPTASFEAILRGEGARAGLGTLIDQRKAADGVGGLGRLTATFDAPSSTATIAEDGTHPYGFKLAATSAGTANIVPTYTAGPPASLAVNIAALPLEGEALRLQLTLPDGTSEEIVLTARAQGSNPADADGFAIGATTAATASNLRDAMAAALGKEARTTLSAASASYTATDFFGSSLGNPPERVPGPPFATATAAPVAGSDADTVIWYRGDDGAGLARATATVQVDQSQIVGTGARANEQAFQIGLAQFAVLALEKFPPADVDAPERYAAMTDRASEKLRFSNVQKPSEIATELSIAQTSLQSAKERHTATKNYFGTALAKVENVTDEDVIAQILAVQNRLQASYQTTSILSQLTLTNYL